MNYATKPMNTSAAASVDLAKRVVFGSSLSTYVFKVTVAMAEKNLDFNLIETLPVKVLTEKGQKPSPAFTKVSPLGKIPAYQEGDWGIADSSVIIAYLDRKNPGKSLYPADAKEFAETLWFEKYGDGVVAGVVHDKILLEKIAKPKRSGKPADEVKVQQVVDKELPEILDYLEKTLQGKEWIVGNDFTAADISIGAQLVSLKNCGIDISSSKWPNVARYSKKILTRPSFQKNMKGSLR